MTTSVGKIICSSFFISLLFISGNASAEIYKWVDANGKVHYSDRKVDAAAIKLNTSTGATTLGQSSQDVEQRLMQQKKYLNYLSTERAERQEKRQALEQQKAKQKKYCAAIQDQLRSYTEEHTRWYELDEQTGERQYISDAELESRKQELQAEIKSSCS